jgi:hypothetical protein
MSAAAGSVLVLAGGPEAFERQTSAPLGRKEFSAGRLFEDIARSGSTECFSRDIRSKCHVKEYQRIE